MRGDTPRLRELLALGSSGGLVPCPAGLTIIALGLQNPHRLPFAFLILVFFSIGLGAVLVAIGVLLITGKALARNRGDAFFQELKFLRKVFPLSFLETLDRRGLKMLKVVPAASCLFIAGLGAFFLVRTSIVGKTEIIAMLRLVADWLARPSLWRIPTHRYSC